MRFEITLFAIRNGHLIGTNQFDNSRDHNKPSHVGRNHRSILVDASYQPYRETNAGGSRSAGLSPASVKTIPISAGVGS
jgi:hypothetical protein